MKFTTINPATEEKIEEYEVWSQGKIVSTVEKTRQAFISWRQRSIPERTDCLRRLAQVLRRNLERYAQIITTEMGKPIKQSRGEVEKCAWAAEVYADKGANWLAEEILKADGKSHRVVFQPLGVILSIMPWNFPFWQAFRFGIPTILAGNVSILKHAENVTQCAFAIEEAFAEAEFGADVYRAVLANHEATGELIKSDLIAGVSLTGSTRAGSIVGQTAGSALKKHVLELGGSDAFIVLEDANPDFVGPAAILGRMQNTGQSCIAAKRFIVYESIAAKFIQTFRERAEHMIVGDPMAENTELGPLVNERALEEIESQVRESVAQGAKLVTGGKRLDGRGYFYAPTILSECTPEMRCMQEEIFGPVAAVATVKNDEEAIRIANQSDFGLGASIWTQDLDRAQQIGEQLEAGCIFINSIVKSDPRIPFGGVKKSGIGRELSKYGLREFVNVKAINVYEHK